jgi:hypothetical protein
MIYESSGIEHERVLRELRQVFDETTTEVLGRVLGRMAARIEEMRVTREDFRELRAAVTVVDRGPVAYRGKGNRTRGRGT